ncbi:hypothetical protein evm_001601 [Chilo suppressalis]|nr:hypothetical protein evm_001601 [Chilo suppressalis]
MMQHQYWVTKKTVLKKFGTKEDECIVSSDAELDAKLELFRSISDSCLQLQRVLDQYQERLCILAQEENSLGKFLRDAAMEKARIEYRAALSWMKSTSAQLDPDTGRGLDNFRKAQRQVRESKKIFDKLTLDVLQKIDLLAAARCNMFSHVLSNYQSSFLTFTTKVAQTLTATADTMKATPQYEFSILKELSQTLAESENKQENVASPDKDQMLFFQDEYKDDKDNYVQPKPDIKDKNKENQLPPIENADNPSTSTKLVDTTCGEPENSKETSSVFSDLAGLQLNSADAPNNFGSFMPSQLLQDLSIPNLLEGPLTPVSTNNNKLPKSDKENASKPLMPPKKEDKAAWFKLFAELDPLANPDSLLGSNANHSHAA